MVTLPEWLSLDWRDRMILARHFKIKQSVPTKVVQIAPGTDVVEDDGIRDMAALADTTLEALKALAGKLRIEKPKLQRRTGIVDQTIKSKWVALTKDQRTKIRGFLGMHLLGDHDTFLCDRLNDPAVRMKVGLDDEATLCDAWSAVYAAVFVRHQSHEPVYGAGETNVLVNEVPKPPESPKPARKGRPRKNSQING